MDTTARLWKVRRTVFQLLRDRGYVVSDEDYDMQQDDFKEKFGDFLDSGDAGVGEGKNRDQLTILTKMAPTEEAAAAGSAPDVESKIFVFFPSETKIGLSIINQYVARLMQENVSRCILVLEGPMTPFARSALSTIEKESNLRMEVFMDTELLVNITQHVLVPEHTVLTDDEKRTLLKRYRVKGEQLPRIQHSDPIARYYGMNRGQVAKIVRPSETAGRYVTYRLCV